MSDQKTWNMVSAHLIGNESPENAERFMRWFNQSEKNKELFNNMKCVWNDFEITQSQSTHQEIPLTFFNRFSWQKTKHFILNQSLSNLVGFVIAIQVTTLFSHHVLERKSIKNLFGVLERKSIVVDVIPEWLQKSLAILIGYIVLELISYFFQSKKHLVIFNYFRRKR